jgi:hypothetical protein
MLAFAGIQFSAKDTPIVYEIKTYTNTDTIKKDGSRRMAAFTSPPRFLRFTGGFDFPLTWLINFSFFL